MSSLLGKWAGGYGRSRYGDRHGHHLQVSVWELGLGGHTAGEWAESAVA